MIEVTHAGKSYLISCLWADNEKHATMSLRNAIFHQNPQAIVDFLVAHFVEHLPNTETGETSGSSGSSGSRARCLDTESFLQQSKQLTMRHMACATSCQCEILSKKYVFVIVPNY